MGAPGYTFDGDPNTGIYASAADTVDVTAGGTQIATFDSAGLTVQSGQGLFQNGTAGAPAVSAEADPNTGLFFTGSDGLAWSTAGSMRMSLNSSGALALDGGTTFSVPSLVSRVTAAVATAVAGTHYLADTSGGAFAITLPTGGAEGDTIWITDVAGGFGTNNLTVTANAADDIEGGGAGGPITLGTAYTHTKLVYDSTATRWIVDTEGQPSFPLLAPNGTAGAPSYSFSNDTDAGMFLVGASDLGFSVGGTQTASVTANGLEVDSGALITQAGAVGAPAIQPTGDTNTGIYFSAADTVDVSAGGSNILSIGTASVTAAQPILAADGAVGGPGYGFSSDVDTGIFLNAVANPVVAVAGSPLMSFTAAGAENAGVYTTTGNGTAAAPVYSFSTDLNLGMYRQAADHLGLAATTYRMDGLAAASANVSNFIQVDENGDLSTVTTPAYQQAITAAGSWGAASGGEYTITVTAATHKKGTTPSIVQVWEDEGTEHALSVARVEIVDASGNVQIKVSETPDGRFDGRIVIL